MSPEMIELLQRIQSLERQLNARPASLDRANSPLIDRNGGTVGNLTGVVRWNGSSPSWTQTAAAGIDNDSRVGFAVMVNSGKPTVYLQGAVWIDHAFGTGVPLYCDPTTPGALTATKPTATGDSTRIIAYAGAGGWIWLTNTGKAQAVALTDLTDVDIDPGDLAEDNVISWDATDEKWVRNTVAAIGLGSRLATSVIGNATNAAAAASDIQADTNQRYFGRRDDALGFFQIQWADLDLTDASLDTGGDLDGPTDNATVVAIQAQPVSATTPVDNDTLIYDGGTLAWVPAQLITTQGALLTVADPGTGNEMVQLDPGDAGTFLMSSGTGENLSWSNGPLRIADYSTKTQYSAGATHNFTAGKTDFIAILCGGGGGGGSTSGSSGASGLTAGGGGGAGAVVIAFGKITVASMTIAIGSGGTAGTGTSFGGDGGDTTITINGDTLTAPGGFGGSGSSNLGNGGSGGIPSTAEMDKYAQSDDAIAIPIPGGAGQPGRITSVSFDGLGAVTGLVAAAGIGGNNVMNNYGGGSRGTGGTGAYHSGIAATAGQAGTVVIYEL